MNMSDQPKQIESKLLDEVSLLANTMNLQTQQSVLAATGIIGPNETISSENLRGLISERISLQLETLERPRVCFFICPKLDATDMSKPENLMPTKLSIDSTNGQQADIFVSRIPRIFQLFESLAKTNSALELVLIIGDSDFAPGIGYNSFSLKSAMENGGVIGNFEESIYAARVAKYKNYIMDLLDFNRVQNRVELYSVDDRTMNTSDRTIKVVSLYESYKVGAVPVGGDYDFDLQAIDDESALKYGYFQDAGKYDPNFFRKISRDQVREITLRKFNSYRDQGLFVRQMGGILIADELPPVVKAEMYGSELLMFWPWIRKEAPERNSDFIGVKPPKVKLIEPPVEN